MIFKRVYAKEFLRDVKKIQKDRSILERLYKKIDEILQNPEHYKPLRYDLKVKEERMLEIM